MRPFRELAHDLLTRRWPVNLLPAGFVLFVLSIFCAVQIGYHWPRDVEIASTQPITFHYEITDAAAKFLLLRDGPKCGPLQ